MEEFIFGNVAIDDLKLIHHLWWPKKDIRSGKCA